MSSPRFYWLQWQLGTEAAGCGPAMYAICRPTAIARSVRLPARTRSASGRQGDGRVVGVDAAGEVLLHEPINVAAAISGGRRTGCAGVEETSGA